MWYHMKIIEEMMEFCQNLFPTVAYAYTCLPTYPGGQIGLLLCSKDSVSETYFLNCTLLMRRQLGLHIVLFTITL